MGLNIRSDGFGRMICTIAEDGSEAVVTARDLGDAAGALSKAIDSVAASGIGECYWPEGVGEYRWVFRLSGDQIRVAVLWSTGTMTGWEHVFWAECDYSSFTAQARAELRAVSI